MRKLLTIFSFLLAVSGFSQTSIDSLRHLLVDENENVIHNRDYLIPFFEKLYSLEQNNSGKINIVHIGDSHIQGDYMTSVVRRQFQNRFGNGGRGFIVPLTVAGTNEPPNFITHSNNKWRSRRCVVASDTLALGLGGITIHTDRVDSRLHVYLNDLWKDYSFANLSAFGKFNDAFEIHIRDTLGNEIVEVAKPQRHQSVKDFRLTREVDAVTIYFERISEVQRHATLFGLNIINDSSGVVYSAIGVNGAKFKHWNSIRDFPEQSALLEPALFIISLGTNESVDYPYIDSQLSAHITQFIKSVSKANPDAVFLFTTPPDSFRKRTRVNPGVGVVRKIILDYAVENGYAFYDLYNAMGGSGSAQRWTTHAMQRSDGVHFSRAGYELQGQILFDAMLNAYNEYVSNRLR